MTAVRTTLGVLALTLAVSVPARAETIVLTSGAFNWMSGGGAATVTMSGSNFSFTGAASPFSGIFFPFDCNIAPECTTGNRVNLATRFVDSDIRGTATYNGVTYNPVGGIVARASLDAGWDGSLLIPATFVGGALTAPFTFAGEFYYDHLTLRGVVDLLGKGTATLNFTPSGMFPGTFNVTGVRYEFDAATPAPVPEPTSMLLIGSGLAGLAALRKRRNRGHDLEG